PRCPPRRAVVRLIALVDHRLLPHLPALLGVPLLLLILRERAGAFVLARVVRMLLLPHREQFGIVSRVPAGFHRWRMSLLGCRRGSAGRDIWGGLPLQPGALCRGGRGGGGGGKGPGR